MSSAQRNAAKIQQELSKLPAKIRNNIHVVTAIENIKHCTEEMKHGIDNAVNTVKTTWNGIKNWGSNVKSTLNDSKARIKEFSKGAFFSLYENIADPFGFVESLYSRFTGKEFINRTYISSDERAFYAGRLVGDVASILYGYFEFLKGIETLSNSVVIVTGGAAVTITGVGAPAGVAVEAVSVVGVVEGVAEITHGSSVAVKGFQNFSNDLSDYSDSRIKNPNKSESPVWKSFDNAGNGRKTSGKGKNKQYYEWDNTHHDIEVYDRNGKHLGSMDPMSGEMYKPAVPGRTIDVN